MSGFDDFYHPQYYSLPASNRDHDDPQNVQDPDGDPVVTSSLMGYPQSGAYDFGHYQNVYGQSQEPSVFRDDTPSTSTSITTGHPTHANQLQTHSQQPSHPVGYPTQGSNLEDRLSNVNSSYGPWSGAETPMLMNPHAGSAFPYDFSTYPMPPQLTPQHMGLNPQSTYSTLQAQTLAQNTYWGMDGYHPPQQDQPVSQGQYQSPQVYSQSHAPQRTLQPRAIQPKKQPFQDNFPPKVKSESHIEASPYTNIYSTSGFDILGVLARVISRPDPKINIGAVDLSCAFVLCDITQDDQPIVYMSEAFGRLTGYCEEEIVGGNCRFLQSPDGKVEPGTQRKFADSNTVYRMRTTIEERNEIQVSVINHRKGGQPFMNLVTMVPIRWDSNEYRFYVGFQVDLVEKPDAVTKKNPNGTYMINYQRSQLPNYVVPPFDVRQSHPDLAVQFGHDQVSAILRSIGTHRPDYKHYLDQILVENADDIIHVLSYDGVFLYLSPSCQKVLEYESFELVNKTLSSVCHPSDIGAVTRDLRTSTTTAPISVVYRIRKKYSGYAWFESHGAWHVEQGRGRTFLVLIGRERPVYHLGQVAGLGNNALGETDAWAKISASGIILYISTKVRPVLGRTQDDLVGTSFKDLSGAESHSEVQRALQSSRNGQRATFSHQVRHKKGHMVQAQTVLFPGDTKEGDKPSFLVAQMRFPKSSQPSSEEPTPTETTTSIPARDQTKSTSTDQQQTLVNASSANHLPPDNQNISPPEQITIFPELIPTRGSSWQFELRELEKRNRGLSDELQRLLTRKKKRKRKQTSMPVGKICAMCQTKNTPEWRRGPSGSRDLCNSCGLRWAKQVRIATQIERSGSA